jgi:hypothetical protein
MISNTDLEDLVSSSTQLTYFTTCSQPARASQIESKEVQEVQESVRKRTQAFLSLSLYFDLHLHSYESKEGLRWKAEK